MPRTFFEAQLKRITLVREGRTVLRDIDWTIRPGERWVLAGANGAGKTQLLKLVAGAVWPTPTGRESRQYRWRRRTWTSPFEVRDEIAYLGAERQDKYERYGWNHTVEQIVGTGLYRTDIPLEPLNPRDCHSIAALLRRLAIAELAQQRFLRLSYGERRMVLLARALASRPRLILLDELLNGFDTTSRTRTLEWLASTHRARLPWVLATHRAEDVPSSATHALVLAGGRVVYRGPIGKAPLHRWLDRPRSMPPPAQVSASSATRSRREQPAPLVRLAHARVYLDGCAVLGDISLELRRAQCWVLHGPNGSGKSSLLRAIHGDYAVAAGGTIERAGIGPGVPLETFKRRVGFVAPHLHADLPRHLTVAEVVQSGRHASIGLNDPPDIADRAAARRALAFFGLTGLAERALRELSYGQVRRVLFARAWVGEPELVLLDEPFAGIDAPTCSALLGHVERLVARGTAVVMATHHPEEWPCCVTHELELHGGRSRYCGPVRASGAAAVREAAS